jgi:glycosyltransferase involved in cell wall biosynthesis
MLNRFSSLIPDKYKTFIEIHLYTSDIFSNTHFDKIIKFKGEVTGLDLIHAMKESDIFLHLESDNYKDILKTYYSISTKIPEYMINKKPILAFGPAKIASFRLLSENNIGFILESNLPNNLIDRKLIDFLDNFNLRKKLSDSAYYYALSHFDNYKIRNEFELKIKKYTT